jgi:hypothetical protein
MNNLRSSGQIYEKREREREKVKMKSVLTSDYIHVDYSDFNI